MSWMQTYTGRKFYPLAPRPEDVCLEDIAHALSNICRFGGHCQQFYSVAQHSVLMAQSAPCIRPSDAVGCLIHDAAEAYIGDIIRPLKSLMSYSTIGRGPANVKMIEHRLLTAIKEALNIPPYDLALVKELDDRMLETERRYVMGNPKTWSLPVEQLHPYIDPWTPTQAERYFLECWAVQSRRMPRHPLRNQLPPRERIRP